MDVRILSSIDELSPPAWDAVAGDQNPFTRYAFLAALERAGCLGERFGWIPQHIAVFAGPRLVAAAPMYLKDNSYGEFVFDWAWADAYARHGHAYYPKLVVGVPYTPATGPRVMVAPDTDGDEVRDVLIRAALDHARDLGVSSVHWLFTTDVDTRALEQRGFLRRVGCQFHWHNHGYRNFDEFLATFSSKKRKQVRRERRRVIDAGVTVEVLHGDEVNDEQWQVFHDFYCSTFHRKSGYPTLSLEFFRELGNAMPQNVVLVLASHGSRYVAGAFNVRGGDTLYGRHWGCSETFDGLHFELCYYRTLEYCIQQGLMRFEAGAQGEHKVSRGFVPVATYSAHWLRHPAFRDAIADFLNRERKGIDLYMAELAGHTPYKTSVNRAPRAIDRPACVARRTRGLGNSA